MTREANGALLGRLCGNAKMVNGLLGIEIGASMESQWRSTMSPMGIVKVCHCVQEGERNWRSLCG